MSGEGSVEAGSGSLTLTCTVRETISGLTNMPSALWAGPSGPVEDRENVILTGTTSDATATLTLTFPSLLTSQAGGYTCQGTVVTPAGVDDVTITSTPPHYVTVSCKYHRMELTIHFLHPISMYAPISVCVSLPISYLCMCLSPNLLSLYVSLSQCPRHLYL